MSGNIFLSMLID
jgi:hypothetical protein